MFDLYYRYNRVINKSKIDLNTRIDNPNPSNVIKRRRALEWLI